MEEASGSRPAPAFHPGAMELSPPLQLRGMRASKAAWQPGAGSLVTLHLILAPHILLGGTPSSPSSKWRELPRLQYFPVILCQHDYGYFSAYFWQVVLFLFLPQDCKQINEIKFLLFLNIKSNFIYINILHCYCVDKCEMYYIIKIRTLKCTIIY